LYNRLTVFATESISGKLRAEVEISTNTYDLVDLFYSKQSEIRKLIFIILTDKVMSEKITAIGANLINDIPCDYQIWDIDRLHKLVDIGSGNEPIEINLDSFIKNGIPCLEASSVDIDHCKCYLCVLPGTILADIYDVYGSRLLEGNVRAFLSARGNVNKTIRSTILGDEKNMFFAYNNGIAATASEVSLENIHNQPHLLSIKNLQIVNGGQTTASLSNTRHKDKASLEGIFVQMKLTVVNDNEIAGVLIPKISRFSNSQNKVSEADFFSNHEFNIRMEKISRRIFAPASPGAQYETHWFYERARGQYENAQSKLSVAEKKKFLLVNPKSQKFDKTMFAKIDNTWRGLPHFVSKGAQKNFVQWASIIIDEWKNREGSFNDLYFKNTIATLVIYNFLNKKILKEKWYEQGYKANIMTYTIALLNHLIKNQYSQMVLDRQKIWQNQKMDVMLESVLLSIAEKVFYFITDDKRTIINVTEWCKKAECWDKCKNLPFTFPKDFEKILSYVVDVESDEKASLKTRKMQNGIESQMEVLEYGVDFWKKVVDFVGNIYDTQNKRTFLDPKEWSILKTTLNIERGTAPSEKQCAVILQVLKKVRDEGFKE
ncbi:MAG: AIPR family protein, partial [Candidatus Cloacimonetes bacterium]|nr:AIPR family protein [Candidatus Cloacimonadota bacterium]